MKLNEIKAVVTGGVSGLGFAVAQRFVADGGKVALLDVNADKAADAVAALGEANAKFFKVDVTSESDVITGAGRCAAVDGRADRGDELRRDPRRRSGARVVKADAAG
jgi:NAD(P)-dependent dehydrogenase (short-subunit alcohol dehydrogenase family)